MVFIGSTKIKSLFVLFFLYYLENLEKYSIVAINKVPETFKDDRFWRALQI